MYKRCIIFLAIVASIIIGTSLAQEMETVGLLDQSIVLDESPPILASIFPEDSSGMVDLSGGSGQDTTSVDTGIVGSSGLVFSGSDSILLSGEIAPYFSSGGISSGPIQDINSEPIHHLILSEVYYDGTDERFEITNIGDKDFQGNFTIVGVKSTPLSLTNISILSGQSKIFGDNISQVSGNRFIGKTGLSLNMIDTAPINIQLIVSGQQEELFLVDQYRVDAFNDKKTSFEKIDGVSTWVQTGRILNAQSGYTINPGMYFRTGNHIDVSFPPTQSGENIQLPISCVLLDQRDLIKINEIFPGNEKYPPYVELIVKDDFALNSLSISGNRLATGLEFLFGSGGMTMEKNSLFLISSTGFRNDEGFSGVRNDDFLLVSTGNRLVITIGYGQTRQVMDIVYGSGDITGSSSYFASTSYQCARVFDVLDDFSPGFERKFLKYFSGMTTTKIEYILTGTQIQTGNQTCLTTGQTTLFSGDTLVTTDISGIIYQYTIHIMNIDYDPEGSDTNNEKITLLATNASGNTMPLDLSKTFRLKVNGTNKTLPRTLPMNTETTFTKTFGFPNSTDGGPVIVQLVYGDHVFDTYIYTPNIAKEEEEVVTGVIESTGNVLDLSGLQFSITYVLPNPKGSDKSEELGLVISPTQTLYPRAPSLEQVQFTLPIAWRGRSKIISSLRSGEGVGGEVTRKQIDLSQGFSLKIGNKTKKLKGIVHIGQENILSGNLGLVNKAACVSLFYNEQERTKFCYRTPKEGEKIYSSDTGLEMTSQEHLDILNTLQLKKINNKLCIRYQDQSFLCKNIPAGKAALKTTQEQKLYKGLNSLVKKYIIDNRKDLYYATPLKSYYDRVTLDKKLIAKGISHIDIYGQSVLVTDLKQQMKIIQTTLPGIVALFMGADILR